MPTEACSPLWFDSRRETIKGIEPMPRTRGRPGYEQRLAYVELCRSF